MLYPNAHRVKSTYYVSRYFYEPLQDEAILPEWDHGFWSEGRRFESNYFSILKHYLWINTKENIVRNPYIIICELEQMYIVSLRRKLWETSF